MQDGGSKPSLAFWQLRQIGRVLSFGKAHWNSVRAEVGGQPISALPSAFVRVQRQVQPVEPTQQVEHVGANCVTTKRKSGHTPQPKREQVGRSLDDAHFSRIADGIVPSKE